jgi:hypothetical protein
VQGTRAQRAIEDERARVAHPVNAVPHAHDAPTCSELGRQPDARLDAARGVEHVEHGPRRAAVQRPFQGAERRQNTRHDVRASGSHDSRSKCRSIQAMIRDRDPISVERARVDSGGPRTRPPHKHQRRSSHAAALATLLASGLSWLFARNILRTRNEIAVARAEAREAVARAQELGSYRLVEMLGKGGMGEVWRAEHRLLVRQAAIKLVSLETGSGVDAVEAELAALLEQCLAKKPERRARTERRAQSHFHPARRAWTEAQAQAWWASRYPKQPGASRESGVSRLGVASQTHDLARFLRDHEERRAHRPRAPSSVDTPAPGCQIPPASRQNVHLER